MDPAAVLKALGKLPFEEGKRYWPQPEENVICGWPDDLTGNPQLRLATIRRASLPMSEESGVITPLDIAAGGGIYEPIHVVFFDNGIVGVEFNFYGPRPSRIAPYLFTALPKICPVFALDPLIRRDVSEQLDRLQGSKCST